jgi:hypothetical protein
MEGIRILSNELNPKKYSTRLAMLLLLTSLPLYAQTPSKAPIPAQLVTAKTAFLGNDGSNTAYKSVYQALASWNQYQLVSTPTEAELTFEISVPNFTYIVNGDSLESPYLHLVVRDTKTHSLLWALSESIGGRREDKDYDKSALKLINGLKSLAAGSFPNPPTSEKKTSSPPKTRLSQENPSNE